MEYKITLGNDNGNSLHKIKFENYSIEQPNVISKTRIFKSLEELNKNYIIKNIENNLIVTIDSPSCEVGNYYIGNKALNSAEKLRNIEIGIDNSKITSDIPIINTLAQIAGYVLKNNSEEILSKYETIIINVDMATALPITQFSKKNAEEFANKFMNKKHKVTLHLDDATRVDFEIYFEFVKVIPEGVDTIWALKNNNDYLNDYCNQNKKDICFDNKKILHVPIGEGSTDLAITDDVKFNPDLNLGLNLGVGHAIERSLEDFRNEIHLKSFTRQQYSEVLKDVNHKYHAVACDIIEQYLDEEADDIIRYIKSQLQKVSNDIDIIVVYGGGSILMRNSLESKLNEVAKLAKTELYYIGSDLAVNIEADGLYNFAISNIFETLKTKQNGVETNVN